MWILVDFETVEALCARYSSARKAFSFRSPIGNEWYSLFWYFFPEFAICLYFSAQVNNELFAGAVPHGSCRFRPHPSAGKATFVLSKGADEFDVFGSKASSRPRSRLYALGINTIYVGVDKRMFDLPFQVVFYPAREWSDWESRPQQQT